MVLSGPARFTGTQQTSTSPHNHTYGSGPQDGVLYVDFSTGDLVVIPAGVTHKSFDVNARNGDPACLTREKRIESRQKTQKH